MIALNSSYVHTNPAVRNLAALGSCEWREYNINQKLVDIVEDIYAQRPQIAAFSCYIWNIAYVLHLAQDIKKLLPDIQIMLGGPEVSYGAAHLLAQHSFLDAIVSGEAETAFLGCLGYLYGKCELPAGVMARREGDIVGDESYNVVEELSILPAPFANDSYDNTKIYYYESSRGCPFSCAYCLSGDCVPVREKPLDIVFADMQAYEQAGAKLVKFTDRTFNVNKQRTSAILDYIANSKADTCYHFEVALDLMDDEMVRQLNALPKDRVQLEAGVQSCNEQSLEAVARKTDITKVKKYALQLLEAGNIHLHLDLIAGLPYEDISSFENSFNQIYQLYPQHLQLGFLKLLKGSKLRLEAEQYGIVYREYPPYEVLYTNDLSAGELFLLKGIDELLNRYYNTGRARNALDYITKSKIVQPFAYFKNLYYYCVQHGFTKRPIAAGAQFEILMEHGETMLSDQHYKAFLAELKKDYIQSKIKGRMPEKFLSIYTNPI